MKNYIAICIMLSLIIMSACTSNKVFFSLLSIDEAGNFKLVDKDTLIKINQISYLDRHQLIGGCFYDGWFYIINENNEVSKYNIKSGEKHKLLLLDGKDFPQNNRYKIHFVDEDTILFSHYPRYLYKIERKNLKIFPIPISNNSSTGISYLNGVIYYSNYEGEIAFSNGIVEQLCGIKGKNPSVSPNGRYIAYISKGFLSEKICIFDVNKKEIETVIRFYLCSNSHIRWSSNSQMIALHPDSEFSLKPFYIIDIEKMKIIFESKKIDSVNWFFFEDRI